MAPKQGTIAHVVGGFGSYHLGYVLLAFIRHLLMSAMTHSGPLVAPLVQFNCLTENPICMKPAATVSDNTSSMAAPKSFDNKCYTKSESGNETLCPYFDYDLEKYGPTITSGYHLICEEKQWRLYYHMFLSMGVGLASLTTGPLSDRYGRNYIIHMGFWLSLKFNLLAWVAHEFEHIVVSRICSIVADYAIASALLTVMNEICGPKQRQRAQIFVYMGFSVGVAMMPWVLEYLHDYSRFFMYYVIAHVLSGVWFWLLVESPSWQIATGDLDGAKKSAGALHDSSWVDQKSEEFEDKFTHFHNKYLDSAASFVYEEINRDHKFEGVLIIGLSLYRSKEFFRSRQLAAAFVSLLLINFVVELSYMMLLLCNDDLGTGNIKLNYATGFLMDLSGAASSMIMVHFVPRRYSLALPFAILAGSWFALGPLDLRVDLAIVIANVAKFATANLKFIVGIVTFEHFPTDFRQTGFGLSTLMGSIGCGLAPIIDHNLTKRYGQQTIMFWLAGATAVSCLLAFLLKETKDQELPNSLDELDEFSS